jgi:hypothetical protein
LLKSTQISKGYLQGQETIELRLGNRKFIYIRRVFYSLCSQNSEGTRRFMIVISFKRTYSNLRIANLIESVLHIKPGKLQYTIHM